MASSIVIETIGYAAATLGTVVMLPQVWKTIQTRSAEDVSAVMLGTYLVQCVLWGIYGTGLNSIPLIACNVVAFCLCSLQVFLKIKYRRRPTPADFD